MKLIQIILWSNQKGILDWCSALEGLEISSVDYTWVKIRGSIRWRKSRDFGNTYKQTLVRSGVLRINKINTDNIALATNPNDQTADDFTKFGTFKKKETWLHKSEI